MCCNCSGQKSDLPLSDIAFGRLFEMQVNNQNELIKKGKYEGFKSSMTVIAPVDDSKLMSYHIQQLTSEIGEVLAADKRWKNFRNCHYDREEKLEEIADIFIVAMNVAIFSGFDQKELVAAIMSKLEEVKDRITQL